MWYTCVSTCVSHVTCMWYTCGTCVIPMIQYIHRKIIPSYYYYKETNTSKNQKKREEKKKTEKENNCLYKAPYEFIIMTLLFTININTAITSTSCYHGLYFVTWYKCMRCAMYDHPMSRIACLWSTVHGQHAAIPSVPWDQDWNSSGTSPRWYRAARGSTILLSHLENDHDISAYSRGIRFARATCVFSHAFKKEHREWRRKDASCSVYHWVRSRSLWDKT